MGDVPSKPENEISWSEASSVCGDDDDEDVVDEKPVKKPTPEKVKQKKDKPKPKKNKKAPFFCELATTDKSTCRVCETKINKDSLRVGKISGSYKQWYHAECFFTCFKVDSFVGGFSDLPKDKQRSFLSLIATVCTKGVPPSPYKIVSPVIRPHPDEDLNPKKVQKTTTTTTTDTTPAKKKSETTTRPAKKKSETTDNKSAKKNSETTTQPQPQPQPQTIFVPYPVPVPQNGALFHIPPPPK